MDERLLAQTRRNARSVQTTIGWIFWDPGAIERYEALGFPGPLGYIAARCAPLAPAGPAAVVAAFGSISPLGIEICFELASGPEAFWACWEARDRAVLEGLARYAPDAAEALTELGPALWEVVEQLPSVGRPFFAAHLDVERAEDPVLSGWHAVNCLREWRGDTHWALVVAAGLTHPEASILHNAWLGYDKDWIPTSRGTTAEDLDAGWDHLERRGLAANGTVLPEGVALRQHLEDETDRLTAVVWELAGEVVTERFAELLEPPCVALLERVDLTAGPNYQPASRLHRGLS